jgi:hypothetical protein
MKVFSKVVIPASAAKTGGALRDFVWDRLVEGNRVKFESGNVFLHGTDVRVQPTFSELQAVVSNGGSFEGIKLGIEFASQTAAQRNVPVTVRGAVTQDEEGNDVNRTFVEWIKAMPGKQELRKVGSRYYMKASFGAHLLNSGELAAIHGVTGVKVLEWAELIAKVQDETAEVVEL